jgi:hypothetical protein
VSTVLDVHTRISDLYSSPHDQIKEQLRLTIETIKENQESELINNPDYGLLAQVTEEQRIFPLTGAPTPDDLDELLTKVWKEPAFFLTHPLAIAAFGREATRRGTPPPTVSLFGSQFITWRGIPLIPSNKVPVADGKSKILLLRVGDKRQGVVGLFQPGLSGEQSPGLSVRFMGINNHAICVVPDLAVLLARGADHRRAGGARRRRDRQIPRLSRHLQVRRSAVSTTSTPIPCSLRRRSIRPCCAHGHRHVCGGRAKRQRCFHATRARRASALATSRRRARRWPVRRASAPACPARRFRKGSCPAATWCRLRRRNCLRWRIAHRPCCRMRRRATACPTRCQRAAGVRAAHGWRCFGRAGGRAPRHSRRRRHRRFTFLGNRHGQPSGGCSRAISQASTAWRACL